MKKHLLIGAALAASLLLSACGGGTDNATTSSSTTTSSTAAATTEITESTTSSAADTTGSATDSSSTVAPLALDQQSTAWFANFCTGFAGLKDSFSSLQSQMGQVTATTPQEQQAAVAALITELGNKLKGLATSSSSVPAPTIENGPEMAQAAIDGFNQIGDAMIGAATQFGQTTVTDEASLKAAATQLQTTLETEAQKAQTAFSAIDTQSTPGLDAAVAQIPECASMGA